MTRVIVVEDDIEQQEDMVLLLAHCGYEVEGVASAKEFESYLEKTIPDIALLDFNLGDATGSELVARLRQSHGSSVGIVMVTARGMITDRVECRRAGADDYLVKPIDFDELQLVIENLCLRLPKGESQVDESEFWTLDTTQGRILSPDGEPISLTVYECRILQALASEPEQLASRQALVTAMGKNTEVYDTRALEVMISRLRKKLTQSGTGRVALQAARGAGYKFIYPLRILKLPADRPGA